MLNNFYSNYRLLKDHSEPDFVRFVQLSVSVDQEHWDCPVVPNTQERQSQPEIGEYFSSTIYCKSHDPTI